MGGAPAAAKLCHDVRDLQPASLLSLSLPNTAAGCWGWHAEAVGARAPRHACWIEVEHHHTIDLEEPLPSATVV